MNSGRGAVHFRPGVNIEKNVNIETAKLEGVSSFSFSTKGFTVTWIVNFKRKKVREGKIL